MKKAELVFFPLPEVAHQVSSLELAKRLLEREDRLSITFISIATPYATVSTESLDTSHPRIRFLQLPRVDDDPTESQTQSPESTLFAFLEKHKPHAKATISKFINCDDSSDSVQLVGFVLDFFWLSMIDVAKELGIPAYMYYTSGAATLGLYLHPPKVNDKGELATPSFVNSVPPFVLPSVLQDEKTDGYAQFLNHVKRVKETKGVIINTFAELETHPLSSILSKAETGIPPVFPVGPLMNFSSASIAADYQNQHESIMRWLDDQPSSSVIYLCFGSRGAFSATQVKEIATGLEQSGHKFLWSLRRPPSESHDLPSDYMDLKEVLPDGFMDRTVERGRGIVCGWVPQMRILAHHAIGGFVSHCGWNSILESLWFGVPILVWPLYAEQKLNAFQLVKELGLALELCMGRRRKEVDDVVTAEEVERGVRSIMDGGDVTLEVRRRVMEMTEKSRRAVMDGGSSSASLGLLIKDIMDSF